MKKNKILIIILLFKTPPEIIENLKNYRDFNLLILDQGNNQDLQKQIRKEFPNIKYYGFSNKNIGFAKGINFLVKRIKTKYFLCTQPDIVINKKSILNLYKTLKEKSDGIISVPKITSFKNYKKKILKKKVFTVTNILGAIFMADREKFMKLDMFDERFFFYWEDIDLCSRIEKSKFKIYLNSVAIADHKGASSTVADLRTFIIRKVNFKYGEYLFQKKYKKLKSIKILREIIKYPLLAVFYFTIFKFKNSFENLCFFFAVIKYISFGKFKNFD